MRRKCLSLLFVLSCSLFAKGASTAHFCVDYFERNDESYSLIVASTRGLLPDSKWKWPDSIACGDVFWENKLVLNYKDEEIVFNADYDTTSENLSCKICNSDDRLRKRGVFPPSIDFLKAHEYYSSFERENKSPIDSAFVRDLYGKKIKAEWNSALSCSCPSYRAPVLKTTLNIVIDGECPKKKPIAETQNAAVENKPSVEDTVVEKTVETDSLDEGTWVSSECSSCLDKCVSDEEEKLPEMAAGMFPCYWEDATRENHQVHFYGSSKQMNMADKPEGLVENMECFDVNGERFLVFGTNVPKQYYSELKRGYWFLPSCYESVNDFEKMKPREKPFYFCEKESAPGGCKAVAHGIDIVFDVNGKFSGWDRKVLWLYAKLMKSGDAYSFMRDVRYGDLNKVLLPANMSEKVLIEIGNDAAQKTAGMAFYRGTQKVGYEKFSRKQLTSLKEALGKCKAWK